ncbi:MAG TPA: ABC transporter ATP-binding protein [Dinghuibacter sp.]|uniref:ABC transporter ATP-binding protein n=1 Tax=Dinghuibacter sp. TaxID=2024697 RepID=UPI002C69E69C|nr:ABC transporter ATP-binding protein [Dinghuibacter sp.]HTJ11142.1 ABC transporter ATP-binding protein [Dinghuibacter sp.]
MFLTIYGMFFCANAIFALSPLLFGWFVHKLQNDSAHVFKWTALFVAGYISIKFCQWCFHGPARVMERSLAFRMSRNFLQERYHQVMHLPAKWHQDHHSGATINRVRKAYEALREFYDRGFIFIEAICKCVFSVCAIVIFSPLFGSIAVVLGVVTVTAIIGFDRPYVEALEEVNEKEHVVSATLFDTLSNIMTVITLRLEKSMERGLLGRVRQIYKPFRRSAVINEWKWFTTDMMITVIYSVVVAGYIYQHWSPGVVFEIGGLVTLIGYVTQFTSVFQNVAWLYTDLVQYHTNVENAGSIPRAYEESHRAEEPAPLPDNWKVLQLSGLFFTHRKKYDTGFAPQSLHDLSVRIGRGERIALIGESGSGKSTLLSLLRGLYLPESGYRFTADDEPFDLDSLNESVTLFPQEPEIFENTIAYNITLGLPFTDEEVMEVCAAAHFTDVVQQLPEGLKSDIREKGVNLSGGQKQRLALARGVLAARDSDVVLLDEPTSSVDPKTEAAIYERLFEAFAGKAVVSSMHRLHLLHRFDYVYVLKAGRVVGEGNFTHLLTTSEAFQELWAHQKGATA